MKSALEPEVEPPEVEDVDTPFRRRMALAVAVVALFGGVVLCASGIAGGKEEAIGADAQRESVMAMSRYSAAGVQYNEELQSDLGVAALQRRSDVAQTWDDLLGLSAQGDLAKSWDTAAGQVANTSDLAGTGIYANRPAQLLSHLETGPDLAVLRQHAADETAAGWGKMRRLELGVVTLIAVALSLFGLSLTVSPGIRRYLVGPGILIVLVSVAGFAWILGRSVPQTPAAAMNAVADGDRLAALQDYQRAIGAYGRALAADPGYPIALENLSTVIVQASSPPQAIGQYLMSMSTSAAYRAAIADLNGALGRTGDDYVPLVNLGAYYFHVRDYATSVQMSQRAIQLNPGPPLPWMNLGAALLAEGNAPAATQAYDHAIGIIISYPNLTYRRELFSASLTTLQVLAAQERGRTAQVRQTEGAIVAAESRKVNPQAVPAARATISRIRLLTAWPELYVQFTYANVPKGARLAAIIYFRPRGETSWLQLNGLDYFTRMDLASSGIATWPLLDGSCPTAGDYRIEIYNDAHLLKSVSTPAPTPPVATVPYQAPFDEMTLCRPQNWTVTSPGPIDLTSQDHRTAVSIQVVPMPPEPPKTTSADVVRQVLERMADQLSGGAGNAGLTEHSYKYGGLNGTWISVALADGEQGAVWASLSEGPGSFPYLYAMELKFPVGQAGALPAVLGDIRFNV
jgi:tetratricopeptide (TPR) repeat protein